jgi:ParB/RepB/Spo0J family partition protein
MATLGKLAISVIEENPQALRTVVEKDSVAYAELVDAIKSFGLMNPISVREYVKEDGTTGYRILDGLHRKTAYSDLGLDDIEAKIFGADEISDEEVLAMQIAANNNVKTTRTQYAQALKQMQQFRGMTTKELAKWSKRSERWVNETLGLLNLPDAVKKLVDEGKINSLNAVSLKKVPADHLDDFIQQAITDSSNVFGPKVETFVNELKKAASTGRKPVTEYVPVARPRKTSEVKAVYDELTQNGVSVELRTLVDTAGVVDVNGALKIAVEWFLHVDAITVSQERAKWEAESAAKAEQKRIREAEKQAKKEAAAAKAVAEAVSA